MDTALITHLKDFLPGSQGYIVGYDKAFLGYMGRLWQLGLTPYTPFTFIRRGIPDSFSYLIEARGQLIQLSKPEADALCVEVL